MFILEEDEERIITSYISPAYILKYMAQLVIGVKTRRRNMSEYVIPLYIYYMYILYIYYAYATLVKRWKVQFLQGFA